MLFGATGDLAARMVLPAFYMLAQKNLMPAEWRLIGNGRGDVAHTDFRKHVRDSLDEYGPEVDEATWEKFAGRLLFAGGGFDTDGPGSLLDVLAEVEDELDDTAEVNFVHYLAIPPTAFEETAKALKQHGLADHSRIVFEKPYGTSPEKFQHLDATVHEIWDEEQVFRIDTSSARKPPRTCTCCGSPTRCSPGSGTTTTSPRCRSTCRRRSTWPTGPGSTTPPAR